MPPFSLSCRRASGGLFDSNKSDAKNSFTPYLIINFTISITKKSAEYHKNTAQLFYDSELIVVEACLHHQLHVYNISLGAGLPRSYKY